MTNVLFLHGIRSDPTTSEWAAALNVALCRRGTGKLDDRGIGTIAPSWNGVLYGAEPVEDPGPPDLTYVRGGDLAYDSSVGRWSLRQAGLESTLRRRGAGIVAGLVALGPGGMVGGLGMVGLLGGAGGAAIAGGLTGGSAAMVEEKVIYLHALALAEQRLDEQHHRATVWNVLVEMETSLAAEFARLARHSDTKARILKELEAKSSSVERALDALRAAGLGPKLLELTVDDD